MRRYLGFNPQQYGDLYMATVAARCLKRHDPDSHLTFVIAADYRDCAPLFLDHPNIDRIHILNRGRDGFDAVDRAWIDDQKLFYAFNPMVDHDHSDPWWKRRIQTHEAAYMHGVPIPPDDDGKIRMTRWFKPTEDLGKYVAISPFPASYAGIKNGKSLSIERAQDIVDLLRNEHGYRVLQVGAKDEPTLKGVEKMDRSYFEAVKDVLGCRLFIGGDSGFTWLMSGYGFPTLALYSDSYYGKEFVKNIQPVNPNALYLSESNVNEISLDSIAKSLDTLLS